MALEHLGVINLSKFRVFPLGKCLRGEEGLFIFFSVNITSQMPNMAENRQQPIYSNIPIYSIELYI